MSKYQLFVVMIEIPSEKIKYISKAEIIPYLLNFEPDNSFKNILMWESTLASK